jgi:malate synthase
MTVTSTVAHARDELREDHRRLHRLVDRLRETEGEEALGAVLGELHSALLAHFNAEERPGGLYDALGVCVPDFRAPLAALVDDHFRISALLRDMRDRAGRHAPGSFPEAAARLADILADHERREHALVDEAILRDA